jgi:hypothetical protein
MIDNIKYDYTPYQNVFADRDMGFCHELILGNLFCLKPDGKKYKVLKVCDGYIIYQEFRRPKAKKYERSFDHTFYLTLPF